MRLGIRFSGFGFLSGFGLRVSDFLARLQSAFRFGSNCARRSLFGERGERELIYGLTKAAISKRNESFSFSAGSRKSLGSREGTGSRRSFTTRVQGNRFSKSARNLPKSG